MSEKWYSNTYCLDSLYEKLQGGWTSDPKNSKRIQIDIIKCNELDEIFKEIKCAK